MSSKGSTPRRIRCQEDTTANRHLLLRVSYSHWNASGDRSSRSSQQASFLPFPSQRRTLSRISRTFSTWQTYLPVTETGLTLCITMHVSGSCLPRDQPSHSRISKTTSWYTSGQWQPRQVSHGSRQSTNNTHNQQTHTQTPTNTTSNILPLITHLACQPLRLVRRAADVDPIRRRRLAPSGRAASSRVSFYHYIPAPTYTCSVHAKQARCENQAESSPTIHVTHSCKRHTDKSTDLR